MHKPEAGALKRKLDALGYTNQDEASDVPLVRQIVDDLIHTTGCYLALKQQASSGIQHVNHLTDKARLSRSKHHSSCSDDGWVTTGTYGIISLKVLVSSQSAD